MADPHAQDKERVSRCLAGDRGAWEEFVERYRPYVAEAVGRTLAKAGLPNDPALAEDVRQEVFLSLLKQDKALLRTFDWRSPLESLLIAVSVRRTIDALRRRSPAVSLDGPAGDKRLWREVLPSASPEAPGILDASERKDRLEKAIARLPARDQALLRMSYWEDLPAEGIARLLRLKPGSVRTILTRAREKLHRILASRLLLF